jgi:hypothetical protein
MLTSDILTMFLGAIYDLALNINLLGIPKLAVYFNDKDYIPGDSVDSNSTTIKSRGCCLRLTWDHGKHMHNFMHRDSTLPDILLYQGHRYFSAFCLRHRRRNDNGIAFAFSSACSISPSHNKTTALVSDDVGSDEDTEDTVCRNNKEAVKEEWYTPPPSPPCSNPPSPLSSPNFAMLPNLFELGISLSFYDGSGNAETVV